MPETQTNTFPSATPKTVEPSMRKSRKVLIALLTVALVGLAIGVAAGMLVASNMATPEVNNGNSSQSSTETTTSQDETSTTSSTDSSTTSSASTSSEGSTTSSANNSEGIYSDEYVTFEYPYYMTATASGSGADWKVIIKYDTTGSIGFDDRYSVELNRVHANGNPRLCKLFQSSLDATGTTGSVGDNTGFSRVDHPTLNLRRNVGAYGDPTFVVCMSSGNGSDGLPKYVDVLDTDTKVSVVYHTPTETNPDTLRVWDTLVGGITFK